MLGTHPARKSFEIAFIWHRMINKTKLNPQFFQQQILGMVNIVFGLVAEAWRVRLIRRQSYELLPPSRKKVEYLFLLLRNSEIRETANSLPLKMAKFPESYFPRNRCYMKKKEIKKVKKISKICPLFLIFGFNKVCLHFFITLISLKVGHIELRIKFYVITIE